MARTAVPVSKQPRNVMTQLGTLAAPAGGTGVVLDQPNGHVITPKRQGKLAIFIYNSKAGPIIPTLRFGINPPANEAGAGDLVLAAIPTLQLAVISGLDGSRFAQAAGAINLDFDAGATGAVWAVEMPA